MSRNTPPYPQDEELKSSDSCEESSELDESTNGEPNTEPSDVNRKDPQTSGDLSCKRPWNKLGWIFTNGYGKRIDTSEGKRLQCLIPGCNRIYSNSSGSISTLKKHLFSFHQITETSSEDVKDQAKVQSLQDALQDFIIGNRISHRMVEDPKLLRVLDVARSAKDKELHITADMMQEGIFRTSMMYKARLKHLLSKNKCISLTFGRWMGGFGGQFYGATAHFIDEEWNRKEVLIALIASTDNVGERMRQVLVDLDIANKIFTITSDCSSEMVGLSQALEAVCPKFHSQNHIRCLGQVLAEAITSALAPCLQFDVALYKANHGLAQIKATPQAIVFFWTLHSSTIDLTEDDMRWDTCYALISVVLEATAAYNETCSRFGFSQFTVTQRDCLFLEDLRRLLVLFREFTDKLLTFKYPTLNHTSLLYDGVMLKVVGNQSCTFDLIRLAFQNAFLTLLKYCGLTALSEPHAISIAMDPRAKFKYWHDTFHPDRGLLDALVVDVWKNHYAPPVGELQLYTSEPPLGMDLDPNFVLNYWRQASSNLPELAKLARIFLAIPATSAPTDMVLLKRVPRVPLAQDTCSFETLEQYLLLESWKSLF